MLATRIRKDRYFDSVMLMGISTRLREMPGVDDAAVAMGTPANLEWLSGAGLLPADVSLQVTPADLIVALRGGEDAVEAALSELDGLLTGKGAKTAFETGGVRYRSVAQAAEQKGANVALISVPGAFARMQAEEALRAGLHVMVFSDNVPIADEVALKQLASSLGLLVMGPDCGTAIISGKGLGFANRVRRGDVGIVGASGTGTQEVSCLLDALGVGVSHALGTGSHDLSDQVRGLTFRSAIKALGADPATKVLLLISKPPSREVAEEVVREAVSTGKPVVGCFLGADESAEFGASVRVTRTLEKAALEAAKLSKGGTPVWPLAADAESSARVAGIARETAGTRGAARGLFCGGTLCTEAQLVLAQYLGTVHSNASFSRELRWSPGGETSGHLLIDLGDDFYTVGRPHPMIDGSQRIRELEAALADEEVGLVLMDVILGAGAESDPAGEIARVLADQNYRQIPVVISFCATETDPQGFEGQLQALRGAGAHVFRANASAARAVASLVLGDPKILESEE